jgi:hypothetical protein
MRPRRWPGHSRPAHATPARAHRAPPRTVLLRLCPPARHREPTPILRLRYQRSADCLAIGIYLASGGQYTETELPACFGPKTGTPEEGADDTFVLYAGTESSH